MNNESAGEIITFYSYKGGTGRSMALANVACLLSQKQDVNNVLMIDWDLEAPGLHQFFRGKFEQIDGTGDLPQEQLGLIDLFYEIRDQLIKNQSEDEIPDNIFERVDIKKYIVKINYPPLSFMPAGKFDDNLYSTRVNEFNWADFFNRFPSFIAQFAQYLRENYKYTLIDSRTGYTDISGICTSIMPEKLVTVFTPNRQSIFGVVEMIRRAIEYRKQSDDVRPLIVFPLPSRIENAESELQKEWRFGSTMQVFKGYQAQLESALTEVYNLQNCDLTNYFDEYQLQYIPRYSYGEELSTQVERSEERLSLSRSYENFTQLLISDLLPWESDYLIDSASRLPADPYVREYSSKAVEVMDRAESLYYVGKYPEAIKLYELVLRIEPDWERAKEHMKEAQYNLANGILPQTALPPEAATLYGKALSAERVMRYQDALKMVWDAKKLVNQRWKAGDDLEASLITKVDAHNLYLEGVELFQQGQIQYAIEKVALAKSATGHPVYADKIKEYLEFQTAINNIRTEVVGTRNISPATLATALENLEKLEGNYPNHPSLKDLHSRINNRLPAIQTALYEDICALRDRAEKCNLSDAANLIKQARQKIVTLQNFGGYEGLNELVAEIQKLGGWIQDDIDVLRKANEDLDISSRWPAAVWKQTESVRRRRPNDPLVRSVTDRMSFYGGIQMALGWLFIVIIIILTFLLLWWFYTGFIK